MKKYGVKKSRFTLVELLVAMGIFCLLLMVSMQIFGGAQRLWVSSEQKNNVFAAARTSMEFVASRIQANAYSEEMPFMLYDKKTVNSVSHYEKIFFPTVMPMNRKDNSGVERDKYSLRFAGFLLNEDGVLEMRIFSDEQSTNYLRYLPPYRRGKSPDYNTARTYIKEKIENPGSGKEHNKIEIAEFVTSFRLIPYNTNSADAKEPVSKDTSSGEHWTPPYLLEIEISMLDTRANYSKWKTASADEKKEIEQESGYTFRRAVLLGDRRNRE